MIEKDEEPGRRMHGGIHQGEKPLPDLGQQDLGRLIEPGQRLEGVPGVDGPAAEHRLHHLGRERLPRAASASHETR